MGSKGSTQSPPPVSPASTGMNDQALMLMQIMSSMGSQQSTMPSLPSMPSVPQVETTQNVNWADKIAELTTEASTGYAEEKDKKKGRLGTIHTQSLLDYETPTTTGNL